MILVSSITSRLASKNSKKCGELIPVIIKWLLQVEKDDKGNVVKTIKNLSEGHTSFNVKVLKELIFYCKNCVLEGNNLDDILQIIKLLSS